MEILHNLKWGNICDDEWDEDEGQVICRQLGFVGLDRITHSGYFGVARSNLTRCKTIHQIIFDFVFLLQLCKFYVQEDFGWIICIVMGMRVKSKTAASKDGEKMIVKHLNRLALYVMDLNRKQNYQTRKSNQEQDENGSSVGNMRLNCV